MVLEIIGCKHRDMGISQLLLPVKVFCPQNYSNVKRKIRTAWNIQASKHYIHDTTETKDEL